MRKNVFFVFCLLAYPAFSADLTTLSLEELSNLEVTSVSKKPEKSFDAPAAVYVITQEDIHRSGVTSIPEALRLAPGVEVEQIDANNWSIGIRGFTGGLLSSLSRSVLVLMDGRSVYDPLFAGTYWDVQNYPLEDVDRIEVIRGPGGTIWGANAVNGVINIITKGSKETQGGLVSATAGSELKAVGTTRYGGKIGDNGTYRVYGEYFDEGASYHADADNFDAWHMGQSGFRSDWDISKQDQLTVQGDIYRGRTGETPDSPEDTNLFGGNILSRWSRSFDSKTGFTLQVYYDRTDRNTPTLYEGRNTEDIDFQDRFSLLGRQDIVWGGGYRATADQTSAIGTTFFDPADRTLQIYNTFFQDTIAIIPDRFSFIAGSKLEDNDYTGVEVEPSVRLLGTLTDRQTLWSAVSRAVRVPSRIDRDIAGTVFDNGQVVPFEGGTVDSEKVIAYELGYRVKPWSRLSLDVSGFYNDYSDLETLEIGNPTVFANNMEGHGEGFETAADVQVFPWWRMRGTYSLTDLKLRTTANSVDTFSVPISEGETLQHTASLHWLFDLPHNTEIDPVLRYASKLNLPATPAYAEMDLRVAWHMTPHLELSVTGQNLLHDHHAEFATVPTSEVQRGAYAKVTYTWGS